MPQYSANPVQFQLQSVTAPARARDDDRAHPPNVAKLLDRELQELSRARYGLDPFPLLHLAPGLTLMARCQATSLRGQACRDLRRSHHQLWRRSGVAMMLYG